MLAVWALALVGLFLIYLEFFLPGAVMAIGGSVLLIGSIFLFYTQKSSLLSLTLYLLSLSAAVYTLVRFALWRVRSSSGKESLALATEQKGFQTSPFPKEMIGKTGKAATDLTPSGQILIDDQLHEALAEGGNIEKGSDITIIGNKRPYLIVITRSSNL